MDNKVYIVTSGDYSDYNINAVFTDKEKAALYALIHNKDLWEDFNIEEYSIDNDSISGKLYYGLKIDLGCCDEGYENLAIYGAKIFCDIKPIEYNILDMHHGSLRIYSPLVDPRVPFDKTYSLDAYKVAQRWIELHKKELMKYCTKTTKSMDETDLITTSPIISFILGDDKEGDNNDV